MTIVARVGAELYSSPSPVLRRPRGFGPGRPARRMASGSSARSMWAGAVAALTPYSSPGVASVLHQNLSGEHGRTTRP